MKYLVTVSTITRRGRTKLHTFSKLTEAEHLPWFADTHASRKQFKQRKSPLSPVGVVNWPPPPRRDLGTPVFDELPVDGTIDLADGVDISVKTLTVVLDALRSGKRHEVDLADIKCVVSQLGSRITKLDGLGDQDRRHATDALYTEILKRCTKL